MWLDGEGDLGEWNMMLCNVHFLEMVEDNEDVNVIIIIDKEIEGDTRLLELKQGGSIEMNLTDIDPEWSHNELNMGDGEQLLKFLIGQFFQKLVHHGIIGKFLQKIANRLFVRFPVEPETYQALICFNKMMRMFHVFKLKFFSQLAGRKGSRVQGFKSLFSNDFIKPFIILSTSPMSL